MKPTIFIAPLVATLLATSPVAAQHEHDHSKYAGEETLEIPSLTSEQLQGLHEAAGMGMARAAELASYPGPKHVLDLADELALTDDQRSRVASIRGEMLEKARGKGHEIVEAERTLSHLFRRGEATPEAVREATEALGRLWGQLRGIHLEAHIHTRELLTPDQIAAYDRLRGYATDG